MSFDAHNARCGAAATITPNAGLGGLYELLGSALRNRSHAPTAHGVGLRFSWMHSPRAPGSVAVAIDGGPPSGDPLGYIRRNGSYDRTTRATPEVTIALRNLATDPGRRFRRYGFETMLCPLLRRSTPARNAELRRRLLRGLRQPPRVAARRACRQAGRGDSLRTTGTSARNLGSVRAAGGVEVRTTACPSSTSSRLPAANSRIAAVSDSRQHALQASTDVCAFLDRTIKKIGSAPEYIIADKGKEFFRR